MDKKSPTAAGRGGARGIGAGAGLGSSAGGNGGGGADRDGGAATTLDSGAEAGGAAAAAAAGAAGNLPEFSVGELSGALKRTLENAFGRVRVRGEVVECKPYGSGRFYFGLKDREGSAKIAGVVWAWAAGRSGVKPENGIEVIATGKLTTYADRSSYQLVVERLDWAGEGALLARIEATRQRLLAEGLFAAERKRALPMLPAVVGVITSERGAVLHDIVTTLARRFPRPVLLWPVPVQGPDAAARIAAAIAGFSALPVGGAVPRPDVLIVARGGGSLEDLMAFNEEVVVRAAAACAIPLISAVGHETDTTLIDFASDRRAPTPTAAAELAVPSRAELLDALAQTGSRLFQGARAAVGARRLDFVRAERGLPDLPGMLQTARRQLDEAGERFSRSVEPGFARRRVAVERAGAALRHPREAIAAARAALALADAAGYAAMRRRVAAGGARVGAARLSGAPVVAVWRADAARLAALGARLEAVSYNAVLARGFALVADESGQALPSAVSVAPGARLAINFADGTVGAVADGVARRPKRVRPAGQEALL